MPDDDIPQYMAKPRDEQLVPAPSGPVLPYKVGNLRVWVDGVEGTGTTSPRRAGAVDLKKLDSNLDLREQMEVAAAVGKVAIETMKASGAKEGQIEFGVELGGEFGVVIGKLSGKANFKVSLKWSAESLGA